MNDSPGNRYMWDCIDGMETATPCRLAATEWQGKVARHVSTLPYPRAEGD